MRLNSNLAGSMDLWNGKVSDFSAMLITFSRGMWIHLISNGVHNLICKATFALIFQGSGIYFGSVGLTLNCNVTLMF